MIIKSKIMKRMYRQPWHLTYGYVRLCPFSNCYGIDHIISETRNIEVGRPPV